jgi:hypothetical protein
MSITELLFVVCNENTTGERKMSFEHNIRKMFNERYRVGDTPWDSGNSPPDLLEAIENQPQGLPRRL